MIYNIYDTTKAMISKKKKKKKKKIQQTLCFIAKIPYGSNGKFSVGRMDHDLGRRDKTLVFA